jgi:hypothetical protein
MNDEGGRHFLTGPASLCHCPVTVLIHGGPCVAVLTRNEENILLLIFYKSNRKMTDQFFILIFYAPIPVGPMQFSRLDNINKSVLYSFDAGTLSE